MVSDLPNHLQGERPLAEYFENMGLSVESVTVCREVDTLKTLLDRRTKALLSLEAEWVKYVGNPSSVESYDPSDSVLPPLVDVESTPLEDQPGRLVVPHHKRPTMRIGWFKPKIDALEYLEAQFKEADESVKKKRRTGKFKSTRIAFVTFETMSSAVSTSWDLLNNTLIHCIANCYTNSSCSQSLAVYDVPSPRTARHCLDQHGVFTRFHSYARHHRYGLHGPSSFLLGFPNHGVG